MYAGSCRRRCVRGSVYRPPYAGLAATDIDSNHFPIVPAEALDMIVVPLVAFDQTGARLGYGGGCYDRYLPMLSPACQIIGIAFDEQRVDRVPTDAHDLPLPHIISAIAAISATATAVPSQPSAPRRRGQVVGRGLVDVVVEPVGVEQLSLAAPDVARLGGGSSPGK
ncbi:MAG: 5-formyltetrahydrofolate cyclo-ligase [Collinsella sp.]